MKKILMVALIVAVLATAAYAASSATLSGTQKANVESFVKETSGANTVKFVNYVQRNEYVESAVLINGKQFRMFQSNKDFNDAKVQVTGGV